MRRSDPGPAEPTEESLMNRSARSLFNATLTPSTLPPPPPVNGATLKTAGPPTPPPPKDPRPFKPAGPDDGASDYDTQVAWRKQRNGHVDPAAPAEPSPAAEPRPDFADDIDRMAAEWLAAGMIELDPASDSYRLRYVRRWREATAEESAWLTEESNP